MKKRVITSTTAVLAILVGSVLSAPAVQSETTNWNVRTTFISSGGRDVPLRYGDSTFGWKHMVSQGHASSSTYVWWTRQIEWVLKGPACRNAAVVGGKIRCQRTMDGNPDILFTVVFTGRVDSRSRDGRPLGIITAYQNGVNCGC